jgi:hypothetical protein
MQLRPRQQFLLLSSAGTPATPSTPGLQLEPVQGCSCTLFLPAIASECCNALIDLLSLYMYVAVGVSLTDYISCSTGH